MTDDRMHDRLTRAGQDWRGDEWTPEVDLARVTRPHSHLPAYAVAAAAVLAIAGAGWALGQLGGDQPPPDPASHLPAPAAGVVAWKNLPPSRATGPGDLRQCSADELHVTASRGAAAGTAYVDLQISGSDDACRIEGVPTVTLLDHGKELKVYRSQVGYRDIRPVEVTSSPSATLKIGWPVSHGCADVDNDVIRVALSDGSSFTTEGFGRTSCNPGEAALPDLEVQPFRQIDAGASDLGSIRTRPAGGTHIALEGKPGQRLEFTVSVISPRRVVLNPCPDYRIQLYYGAYGLAEEHRYSLNCDGITTRDSEGRPVLMPGRPVEFQMFVTAPKEDVPKLLWLLDGVGASHSHAYGDITVE